MDFEKKLSIHETDIPGLLVIDLEVHGDNRGWFKENWQRAKMVSLGLPDIRPVQNNISFNAKRGTTRGIHAEPWNKFISVASGSIYGAWVDLRPGDTFGATYTCQIDPSKAIFVPRGVGNAFQALEDDTVYTYLVDDHWSAEKKKLYTFVNLADPTLAIDWPISLDEAEVSEADKKHPMLDSVSPMRTEGNPEAKVLCIVPAYNEQDSIESVVAELDSLPYDYVVINDGSTDETSEILTRIGAPHIDLVCNLGIGGAVQTGLIYAEKNEYDIAVQVDGDGQHDPSYIQRIIQPIIEGEADLVVGSRYVGDESKFKSSVFRRMGIKILSLVLKLASGATVLDVTSGFRAVDGKAIKLFTTYYPGDYPEPESLSYAVSYGLKVAEVPVGMRERQGGSSSISGLKPVYYMIKVSLATALGGLRGRRLANGHRS